MPANTDDYTMPLLRLIRQANALTRRDLAAQMGLSQSMISRLTGRLLAQGLIAEAGRAESGGGRPSDLLTLEPRAGYVLGLDIGGRHQRGVLVNLRGVPVQTLVEPTPRATTRPAILDNMAAFTVRLLTLAELPQSAVVGLGVGLRAFVDPSSGVVYGWPNAPGWAAAWTDFAVRDELRALLPWRCISVDDTVRMQGLAEARYGHGTTERDFLWVLAGSGIGAALMLNGTPYVGPNNVAGEIGHIPVGGNAALCECGNIGCLETLASVTAIVQQGQHWLAEAQRLTSLRARANGLHIADVLAAAVAGDKLAYRLLNEAGEHLGSVLAMILNLLGLRLIVVGGVLAGSAVYMDAARRMMKLRALNKASQHVALTASTLGEFAGAHGAATMTLDALFRDERFPLPAPTRRE